MLECVVNVSEGRDPRVLAALAAAAGSALLDVHSDAHHHRSVFTLAGPAVQEAVRAVARVALERIDLGRHAGVHPRFGVLDVVPFVPLGPGGVPVSGDVALGPALAARDGFAQWAGAELGLPCFVYGPERSLPDVRRQAFRTLSPDTGPTEPDPAVGACAVGARPALVAYNLWLATGDLETARALAAAVRRPALRTLGLRAGTVAQVSCNLVDPLVLGPAEVYDLVEARARELGTRIARAELVGLVPAAVADGVPEARRRELDVGPDRSVEERLARAVSGARRD